MFAFQKTATCTTEHNLMTALCPQSSPENRYAKALKYYACTQIRPGCRAAKFAGDDIMQGRTAQSSLLTHSLNRMLNLAAQTV